MMQQGLGALMPQLPAGQAPANPTRLAAAMDVVTSDAEEQILDPRTLALIKYKDAVQAMQSADQLMAASRPAPTPPTVAERTKLAAEQGIMGLASRLAPGVQQQGNRMGAAQMQQPMTGGLPQLPSPNMARMAGGGIVGYAPGGDVKEEDAIVGYDGQGNPIYASDLARLANAGAIDETAEGAARRAAYAALQRERPDFSEIAQSPEAPKETRTAVPTNTYGMGDRTGQLDTLKGMVSGTGDLIRSGLGSLAPRGTKVQAEQPVGFIPTLAREGQPTSVEELLAEVERQNRIRAQAERARAQQRRRLEELEESYGPPTSEGSRGAVGSAYINPETGEPMSVGERFASLRSGLGSLAPRGMSDEESAQALSETPYDYGAFVRGLMPGLPGGGRFLKDVVTGGYSADELLNKVMPTRMEALKEGRGIAELTPYEQGAVFREGILAVPNYLRTILFPNPENTGLGTITFGDVGEAVAPRARGFLGMSPGEREGSDATAPTAAAPAATAPTAAAPAATAPAPARRQVERIPEAEALAAVSPSGPKTAFEYLMEYGQAPEEAKTSTAAQPRDVGDERLRRIIAGLRGMGAQGLGGYAAGSAAEQERIAQEIIDAQERSRAASMEERELGLKDRELTLMDALRRDQLAEDTRKREEDQQQRITQMEIGKQKFLQEQISAATQNLDFRIENLQMAIMMGDYDDEKIDLLQQLQKQRIRIAEEVEAQLEGYMSSGAQTSSGLNANDFTVRQLPAQ